MCSVQLWQNCNVAVLEFLASGHLLLHEFPKFQNLLGFALALTIIEKYLMLLVKSS